MASENRLFGLDVLRSLAIVLVLLSHGRHLLSKLVPELDNFFVLGYLGVELFFVLSGFLIGGILLNVIKTSSDFYDIRNFWIRRWFRTLPNYYLFLAIEVLIAVFITNMDILGKLWRYLTFTQTFIVPIRPTVFSVSWSLAVEEWFYLLMPVIFLLAAKSTSNQLRACILVIGLGISLPLLVRVYFVITHDAAWGPDIRNATVMRLDAIMYGFVGAVLFRYYRDHWEKWALPLFVFGILIVFLNAAYVQTADIHSDWYARTLQFSVVPFGFLCILPLSRHISAPPYLLSVITKISVWSYSLYLCHMLVLRCALSGKSIADRMFSTLTTEKSWLLTFQWASSVGAFLAFIAVSLLVSAFVYKHFEVPMMKQRDRISRKEQHAA